MNKLYFCFIFALVINSSLGMVYRHKRQSVNNDNDDNRLDDRYGWDRPSSQNSFPGPQRPRPNQQWQNQGQQRPFPNPNWQQPNQGGQNWQRPNQGQDWQQPNQNGQDWQRPNQNGQDWQQPNQGGQDSQQPNQGGQDWQQPNQGGQDWQQPNQNQGSTQTPNGNGSTTTTQSPAVAACIRNCPTTPEYNPVCGSDGTTYENAGRLSCAQQCGVNVTLLRLSRCPASTTLAPPST